MRLGRGIAGFVVLFVLAGCATRSGGSSAGGTPGSAVVGGMTAAEGGDGEFTGILTNPSPTPVAQPTPRPNRFGLRTGYLMPMGATDGTWDSTFNVGAFYRISNAVKRQAWELGVDYSSPKRDDGSVTSTLISLRGDFLMGNWKNGLKGTGTYVVGGLDVVSETPEVSGGGSADSAMALGVNLGVGFGPKVSNWDVRAAYTRYPGSGNVKSNILVTFGFSF